MHGHSNVIHKHRSFLSTAAWGITLVIVTAVSAASLIGLYGLNIVDRKTGSVFDLVETAVAGLPELTEALPPALADMIHDKRRPDYAAQLGVDVRLAEWSKRSGGIRPIVELHNNGQEVVSLLSMRIVVLNQHDEPVAEFHQWAATPVTADRDWPGPLLPGSTRHLSVGTLIADDVGSVGDFHAEVEITDVRVWDRESSRQVALAGGEAP